VIEDNGFQLKELFESQATLATRQ